MRFLLTPLYLAPFVFGCHSLPMKCDPKYLGQVEGQVEMIVGHTPPPENILLIGDSEVMFSRFYFNEANVKRSNETIFFDSKPGTTILTWDNIFVSEMKKFPDVDTVIIYLGTNNQNFKFLQPYQNILYEVERRNLKCIWVGNTKVYNKTHIINQLVKAAVIHTCEYFDTEQADIELVDGVHPTKAGAIKWLNMIWVMKNK